VQVEHQSLQFDHLVMPRLDIAYKYGKCPSFPPCLF
jgi:hypothetical protein